MAQQGQEIHCNPLDNDQLHLLDHNKRIQDALEIGIPTWEYGVERYIESLDAK